MKRAAATDPGTPESLLHGLRAAATRSAGADPGQVRAALAPASRTDPGTARELDRAVVAALAATPDVDRLLDRLDTGDLAGLADRVAERLPAAGGAPESGRASAWDLLDLVRRPALLRRLAAEDTVGWAERILRLVERSQLTVGPLFRHRAERYGSRPLFELATRGGVQKLSWRQTAARVERLAGGLLELDRSGEPGPVAIVAENRLETALVDLACLTSGIVNVLIPPGATAADVAYMLRHSAARTVVVSGRPQLRRVLEARSEAPQLRHVLSADRLAAVPASPPSGVVCLDALAESGRRGERDPRPRERAAQVTADDLATIMYTSGTTGTPKGIRFSHRNLVFKRFARGLALPEIGEQDIFLCYLPLYHTFGRFLELLGCIFWGARYCFLPDPSLRALVRGMQRHRPTAFISVPKKWIQLYEAIGEIADPLEASDRELREAVERVTGGRLRWGLSAAGHLDPEIFRFFQQNGVELLSGFGMTEATGGITMTPPGGYKDDSLGPALPGIELRLAADGELLVRGPYVMLGYHDPPEGGNGFDAEGWLPTGDLMERDGDGHLRLVDRKKEIYKNIKGETIAPQRVEKLFRDFPSVRRAFLVGDHRPYNTVLLYPDPDLSRPKLRSLPPDELRELLRSAVTSVNKFLAPFERIVDFAVIDRDLDPERGELTPKGTPRRAVVERAFREQIDSLYRRTHLSAGGIDVTFPNWLFQALGLTAQDLCVEGQRIGLRSGERSLTVRRRGRGLVQVGSCLYRHRSGPLDLGALLTAPRLWLGNEELLAFVPLELPSLVRPGRTAQGPAWHGRRSPAAFGPREREALRRLEDVAVPGLGDLHLAALALAAPDESQARAGIELLARVLRAEEGPQSEPARALLARTASGAAVAVRRRAFRVLAPAERESRFRETLARFLRAPGLLLDRETRAALVRVDLSADKLAALTAAAEELAARETVSRETERRTIALLRLLAEYGAAHPVRYRRLRAFLVRTMLFAARPEVRKEAERAAAALTDGFRRWLGLPARIAVDEETGREYGWQDVVAFDDEVDPAHRQRLLSAFRTTGLLREAVFLFSRGATVQLAHIPQGGVWVRLLGRRHGKTVYRVTIQTRHQGAHELAVNVNDSLAPEAAREEIHWLVLCGDAGERGRLAEDFGGYWADQDLWTEEFIAGETLERALLRLSRRAEDRERFLQMWPFFAGTTCAAYVDFWHRTGRRWEIADRGMSNVVVPTHDYHTGTRIVSVSERRPHRGLARMLRGMREALIVPAESRHSDLRGLVGWEVVLSSLLEITGEAEGLELLRAAGDEAGPDAGDGLSEAIATFAAEVERAGFRPLRLRFAAARYRRWEALGSEPTAAARARTLQEIYDTYGLGGLVTAHPEVRVRFFRDTVLRDAAAPLARRLDELISRLRARELTADGLTDAVADLRAGLSVEADDDYFLARLSFPHLRPEDTAAFVETDRGGKPISEMVVRLQDQDGNRFRLRHAMSPKEIGRLHQLFLAARLDVRFRPEHRYLVALNERSRIIGGIYYDVDDAERSAHLEKIVVAERYRKKGVADGLMNEFFHRLSAAGIGRVTTGFFRPQYFYGYGFRVEKRYAGLVKPLAEPEGS